MHAIVWLNSLGSWFNVKTHHIHEKENMTTTPRDSNGVRPFPVVVDLIEEVTVLAIRISR